MSRENNKVLLITLHNDKSLGIRQIAKSLISQGFSPTIIFLKSNIYNPQPVTEKEIEILKETIQKEKYLFVGFSILSSFTIFEINKISKIIKETLKIPIVWGGTYVSIMPYYSAQNCDIAIRGEGEIPIINLAIALRDKKEWRSIKSLCFFNENNEYIENEIEDLIKDIDEISIPLIDYKNIYIIEGNEIKQEDPILKTDFYELSCSRGCPFNCSYCCSSTIKKIYKGKGKYLRFRSVDNVISELKEAKEKIPNIKCIRFWDEVFSTENEWIKNFTQRYKKEINIPFQIWGHPLLIKEENIRLLKDAGMERIVVGFQSGSPDIRNGIFRRPETNQKIIEASKIISSYKIPEVYYDLMICHPFESIKQIKETFDLCLKLEPPFRLNIHGLGFLPGADINKIAIEKGLYTEEELEELYQKPAEEQFKHFYGSNSGYYGDVVQKEVWADLIFLTQYPKIREKIIKLSNNAFVNYKKIKDLKEKMEKEERKKTELLQKTEWNIIKKIKSLLKKGKN